MHGFRIIAATIGLGAAAAAAGADLRPEVIPLQPYLGSLVMLEVTFAGHPEHFLFDTAGGLTVVTPDFAAASGCKPWGRVTGFRMHGERLDLQRCENIVVQAAGVPLLAPTAGIWDLARVFPKDAPPLAGSLALDAFADRIVTLDLGHRTLVIETPASFAVRVRTAREVAVHFTREAEGLALTPAVGVETVQGRLWMELDSGSDGTVIVNRPLAAALGLDPRDKGGQSLTMTLAGGFTVTTPARVDDLILDGNIGTSLLRTWIVTLDLAHQRLWIAPAPG